MSTKQSIVSAIAGATLCYLSHSANGAIIKAYASIGTNCSLATQSDTCIFYCDEKEAKQDFDCENAGQCDIYCEKKNCLKTGIINATNANQGGFNLYTTETSEYCASASNIYLPTSDNANIYARIGKYLIYNSNIYAGPNTKNISLHCDDYYGCAYIDIFAKDAAYLEISGGADLRNAKIGCPANGNFLPSCVLDATKLNDAEINASIGIDADLSILGNPTYHDTIVNCPNGQSITDKSVPFSSLDVCWPTMNPTTDPTPSPSPSPSQSPSEAPSPSPSPAPSPSPSGSPTAKPSDAPYKIGTPSRAPSESTLSPTKYPSLLPTRSPSNLPSTPPSVKLPSLINSILSPTTSPSLPTLNGPDANNNSEVTQTNDDSFLSLTVGIIIGSLISCVFMMACVICILYKRKDNMKRKEISIQLGSKSEDYHPATHEHQRIASNQSNFSNHSIVAETEVIVRKVPIEHDNDVVPNVIIPPPAPKGIVPRTNKKKSVVVEGPGAVGYAPKKKQHGSRKNTESHEDSQMYSGQTMGDKMTLVGYDEMMTDDGGTAPNGSAEWTAGFIGAGDGSSETTHLSEQASKTINAFKLRQLRASVFADNKPLPPSLSVNEGADTGAQQVAGWLNSLGMDQYYNSFVNSGFNTLQYIKQIDDMSYLAMLDPPISNLAHKILIFKQIKKITDHEEAGDV